MPFGNSSQTKKFFLRVIENFQRCETIHQIQDEKKKKKLIQQNNVRSIEEHYLQFSFNITTSEKVMMYTNNLFSIIHTNIPYAYHFVKVKIVYR